MQIKFKLAHAEGKSFFIVDGLIDDATTDWRWYLPLFFSPPMLVFLSENDATARLSVDLLGGRRAHVVFAKQDAFASCPGGSFLSRCELENPDAGRRWSIGCRWDNGVLDSNCFITTSAARGRILAGEQFWLSAWNIRARADGEYRISLSHQQATDSHRAGSCGHYDGLKRKAVLPADEDTPRRT
jgi:hypothetical protein